MIASTLSLSQEVFMVVVVGGIFLLGVIGSLHFTRARQSRELELFLLAEQLKFESFNPSPDETFVLGWGFLSWFGEGSDRYAYNILRGTYHDQQLFVFDYHYVTGSGKNREDHNLTIFMLIEKDQVFPQINIGRENVVQKIATALGVGNQVQFESAEFSRTFCVRSQDKKFAYDVCNQQMMEYLLANRDLHIEIQGPVISMAFKPLLPVEQIEYNLQRLAQIRSLLPEYLFTKELA